MVWPGGLPGEEIPEMVLLVNALLTVGFLLLFALSVWVSHRLLGADSGPDPPRYIDDDQLANSA